MKKTCKQMGFTEKASCRPYKNCYKGGALIASKKSTRKQGRRSTRKQSKDGEPKIQFRSEQITFTAHPAKGQPFGTKSVISIENGKGTREEGTLNRRGQTLKSHIKAIKKNEMREILHGNSLPGLLLGPIRGV
jgi:hypothetical protein